MNSAPARKYTVAMLIICLAPEAHKGEKYLKFLFTPQCFSWMIRLRHYINVSIWPEEASRRDGIWPVYTSNSPVPISRSLSRLNTLPYMKEEDGKSLNPMRKKIFMCWYITQIGLDYWRSYPKVIWAPPSWWTPRYSWMPPAICTNKLFCPAPRAGLFPIM